MRRKEEDYVYVMKQRIEKVNVDSRSIHFLRGSDVKFRPVGLHSFDMRAPTTMEIGRNESPCIGLSRILS